MRSSRTSLLISFFSSSLLLAGGCTEEGPTRPGDGGGVPMTDGGGTSSACTAGGPERYCLGALEVACNPDGTESGRRDCTGIGQVCAPGLGCTACIPNTGACDGNTAQRCRADGSGYDVTAVCDPGLGETCNASSGACSSPCDAAEASNSYIGCEYWPAPSANPVNASFAFAVVVSNPQATPVTVNVTRAGAMVATRTIEPGAIASIELPWVNELKDARTSALVRGGAYRLRSSAPVTVYQFSPLEYRRVGDCPGDANDRPGDNQCFSFSNDASLLLPAHVLTPNYVVTSFPTRFQEQVTMLGPFPIAQTSTTPGFFSVVAVEEGETTVTIRFNGNVLAAGDGSVRAFASGETGMFTLQQGDVLQVFSAAPSTCDRSGGSDALDSATTLYYCRVPAQYDLTGSEVRATQPVAVNAGHVCAFVPYNRWACDHLEEQLFPEDAWGRDAFVSTTEPLRSEPNVIRIVSARANNMLTFDPPSVHGPAMLHRGEVLEFEASESFRVQGTEAIQVAQFLVGQDYGGIGSTEMDGHGDPSMSLAIPTDQFRTNYAFLAPTTYAQSFVNVTAPMGATVTLDGTAVTDFTPIGSTGFGVARVPVSGGAHEIEGSEAFGIVVYGFGSYTSYMYPGGLDLEEINLPI